ncbi:ABC transporter G family member 18 [Fusarium beomiforme]|uniref:ABC transporter G family member 18 n=1 Tax=Fusarium beomiforme TaxID=44412 RepID=A0A9P5AJG1_9HYPO|nr:ABC transporter G family member 18 [Fusarium beomiforme]
MNFAPAKTIIIQPLEKPLPKEAFLVKEKWNDWVNCDPGNTSQKDYYTSGGFIVEEEQTRLRLMTPCENPINDNQSLIYGFTKDPATDDEGTARVPFVTQIPDHVSKAEEMEDYRYLLYYYKGVGVKSEDKDKNQEEEQDGLKQEELQQDDPEKFIFTGSPKLGVSSITPNIFIQLKELKLRIGLGNPDDRMKAYKQDWLTYLACANSIDALAHVPDDFRPPKSANKTELKDGAVARVAACAAKEAWSVKARFRSIPASLKPPTFYYVKPEEMTGIINKIAKYELIPKDGLPNDLHGKFDKSFIDKAWRSAMTNANKSLDTRIKSHDNNDFTFKGKYGTPTVKLVTEDEEAKKVRRDFMLLGFHPHGFYDTYVTTEDFNSFFPLVKATKPQRKNDLLDVLNKVIPLVPEDAVTETRTHITKNRIITASNWPRLQTQNAVMNNVGAPKIAKMMGLGQEVRSFEWLHRSAYSYGGLLDGNADSSQSRANLIFGTYECNTEMIRYEDYLKRVAMKGYDVKLVTKTYQDYGAPWLVGNLGYAWQFSVPGFPELSAEYSHFFDPFLRHYPTRFEVEFDRAFDDLWLANDVDADLKSLIAVVLLTKSLSETEKRLMLA